MSTVPFDYGDFTTRNIGFITEEEQQRLRGARVFVAGVGGMGGAAVACLVRCGVGHVEIADMDVFEVSNLNRQIFANLDTVGVEKTAATKSAIERINPTCEVIVHHGHTWPGQLEEILGRVDVVINGCDDVRATIALMRKARDLGKTVIDAFASTLPNVYVVRPGDPRPEQLFDYPSARLALDRLDDDVVRGCARKEIEWVMTQSSTADHVVMARAAEMITGKRKRISFAPMVWMTGCLMAYEAVRVVLRKSGGPGPGGVFFNPWTGQAERNKSWPVAAVRRFFVRRFLNDINATPGHQSSSTAAASTAAPTLELRERDFASFFEVPFHVYPREIPWVSMMRGDLEALLDERKNPHWQRAEGTYFTALRNGVPAGRIVAHVHHAANERFGEKAASFGFFDCADDKEVAQALLDKAEAFARAHGCNLMRGNMNLTANQEIGALTEGEELQPFVAQMFQPRHIGRLLGELGYTASMPMTTFIKRDLASMDLNTMVTDKHRALLADPSYTWRTFNMKRYDDDIEIVRQLLNDSMDKNPLFVPMTADEARFQMGSMKTVMDPALTRIAEHNGQPIGVTICIPDPNPLLRRMKSRITPLSLLTFLWGRRRLRRASVIIMLVRREYHGQGVIGVLNHDLMKALQDGGYTEVGGTWISDTNKPSLKQAKLAGLMKLHRLALFEKVIS